MCKNDVIMAILTIKKVNIQRKNIIFFLIGFIISFVIAWNIRGNIMNDTFSDKCYSLGLFPVNKVMMSAGYDRMSDNSWRYSRNNLNIDIVYNYDSHICYKNEYYFEIDNLYTDNGEIYLLQETLEKILMSKISYVNGNIIVVPNDYSQQDWTTCPVITHAGGAVREADAIWYYTNSKDALVQNYSLGCRLFEFDMYPTNDNNLAIVHDWVQFGNLDGTFFSTEEWLEFKTGTSGVTDGKYETMVIGTLLDEMLINPDIFVITDTKSTEFPQEVVRNQFEIIYREAIARDPKLLNRIIPQIYSMEMYHIVQSVYKFPNLIFTCYATAEPGNKIIDFCIVHEEFKAITAPYANQRLTDEDIQKLHQNGLKLYYHSIYTHEEMLESFKGGADGIYTGIFTLDDVRKYLDTISKIDKEGSFK